MSRRWLVLGSHIPPQGRLGGMIRYTVEVISALEARSDVEVHVHCAPETVPFLVTEVGIERDRVHAGATGSTVVDSLIERRGLARLIGRVRPDVVFGTKQLVPRRVRDEVLVLTVHDLLPFDRPGDFGLAKRHLLPPAYRRSLREADLLACVSGATRERLAHHEPPARARAIVVPNAMTSSLGAAAAEPIAGIEDRSFALVVGDRSRRKNLGFIVDLWPEVVARCPDAHLVVVGPPGWGHNEHLPALDGLVGNGTASTPGLVSDGQLRWAYEHAAVTLCPSLLEGFGLPVLEALSLGCPVITSTDPAQVEVAAGRATTVSVREPLAWVDAIVDRLAGARSVPDPFSPRSWADVADDLVAAVERLPAVSPRHGGQATRPRSGRVG